MLQIILSLMIFMAILLPTARYVYLVADGKRTFADPFFDRIDGGIFRLCRTDRGDMDWQRYLAALLVTNLMLIVLGISVLLLQGALFFNPNNIGGMKPDLSLNTIISFMTNTNLQHYAGESGLSYLSQMLVITMMMFTSAATGYSACMAMIRGFCGKPLGNYFVDMVRFITRVLLPLAVIVTITLIALGVPQTLGANITVTTLEGTRQDIPLGPVASLVSIKHLGTNGGGFFGANSAMPFENPSVITNLIEMYSMMLLPAACVIVFGLMWHFSKKEREAAAGDSDGRKADGRNTDGASSAAVKQRLPLFGGQGRMVFVAMAVIFLAGLGVCYHAERSGNPALAALGVDQSRGSLEGKETRLGIAQSALFTTVTTAFTTGTVNNMHDTLTPLGGLVPLLNMMLNTVFGGVGVGLMNMLLYVLLAVFLCALMIGRTPEYLGKKIESREMKLTVLCILLHPLLILVFSALAVSVPAGLAGITNPGFHGLSQVLYEFSSSAANNGSGFEGLADNTLFWNLNTGFVMFAGRYAAIALQLAIAGSLLAKPRVSQSSGTLKTGSVSFGLITAAVVLVFGALTFFPAVSLGPVAEFLTLR